MPLSNLNIFAKARSYFVKQEPQQHTQLVECLIALMDYDQQHLTTLLSVEPEFKYEIRILQANIIHLSKTLNDVLKGILSAQEEADLFVHIKEELEMRKIVEGRNLLTYSIASGKGVVIDMQNIQGKKKVYGMIKN